PRSPEGTGAHLNHHSPGGGLHQALPLSEDIPVTTIEHELRQAVAEEAIDSILASGRAALALRRQEQEAAERQDAADHEERALAHAEGGYRVTRHGSTSWFHADSLPLAPGRGRGGGRARQGVGG